MVNFQTSEFISRLNVAAQYRLVSINVNRTRLNINLLFLFYHNGLVSGFTINKDFIWVFLAYSGHFCVFSKIELISTPGHRVFWKLNKLKKKYSNTNFSGFYVISSNKGLITSNQALLNMHTSGEILFKIFL